MRKSSFLSLIAATSLALSMTAAAASDVLYGLPLAPGVPEPDPRPAMTVCGTNMAFYVARLSTSIDTELLITWYQQNLRGAQLYHSDAGHGRDTLFTGDGLLEVTITTSGDYKTAYSVSFGRLDRSLKPDEMASFNTGQQTCGS